MDGILVTYIHARRICIVTILLLPVGFVSAQELHNDHQGIYHGKVTEIIDEEVRRIPGTDTEHLYQTIKAEVLDGPLKGTIITIENDYLELDKGDKFYFNYSRYTDGRESYGVTNIDRKDSLIILSILFILAVVAFGGW